MKFFFTVSLLLVIALKTMAAGYDAVVARDGSGKYSSVQAAVDAAPEGRTTPYRIFIRHGKYIGQIIIPATKPFIELIGEDVATTTLCYGDGKAGTAAVIINADDCALQNLTLENSQGAIADGPQSLALRTNGSRIFCYRCRFISGQDTVLTSKAGSKIYFLGCYIDGNTDFIYGGAIAVFDYCVIYARDRLDANRGGYITAANTPVGQPYGLIFRHCLLPGNHGITAYTLGRPWQNDSRSTAPGRKRSENKVVFLDTRMSASIIPSGWSVWDGGTDTTMITYAEYGSKDFDGKMIDVRQRLKWTRQLSAETASHYFDNKKLFGDWDPFSGRPGLRAQASSFLAVNNLIARNNTDDMQLQFNLCWPMPGVNFTLYKSGNDRSGFKQADRLVTKSKQLVAYQFKQVVPKAGEHLYYYLKANHGKETFTTDTIEVTAATLTPLKPSQNKNN